MPTWWSTPLSSYSPSSSEPTIVPGSVLVPAEPRHHAVGGALVLHLHHRPLARAVAAVEALGHDAVQAGALEAIEPVQRHRPIGGRGREVHRRPHPGQQLLQAAAAARTAAPRAGRDPPSASRSHSTIDAGVRSASVATRDAAGWIRCRRASKSSPPGPAITISPSSTAGPGNAASSGATTSGKYRFSGLQSRLCRYTPSGPLNTSTRKPSHFGSYSQPGPSGSASASFASMGSIGGESGALTP